MASQFPLDFVRDFFGGPDNDLPLRMVVVFDVCVSPRVFFYDRRFIVGFPENGDNGQQISGYYLSDLLDRPYKSGLDLEGGVCAWRITPEAFQALARYLLDVQSVWQRVTGMETA